MSGPEPIDARRTMRTVLIAFLLTFIAARVTVFLIMARRIPDLFLHVGGTHVHHLSFGILLLSGVGLYLLLRQPTGRRRTGVTLIYGIGLALTFDEFGMWLHLGGGYWQRASFDAVVVIVASLGTMIYAPALKRFRPRTWTTAAVLVVALTVFGVLLVRSFRHAEERLGPELERLERQAPR